MEEKPEYEIQTMDEAVQVFARLQPNQRDALALMFDGKSRRREEIAAAVGVHPSQLWRWRNEPENADFQAAVRLITRSKVQAAMDKAVGALEDMQGVQIALANDADVAPSTRSQAAATLHRQALELVYMTDLSERLDAIENG